MATRSANDARYQLLPELSAGEFAALKRDIAERVVLLPVERDEEGNLLDGHHRMRAVQELRAEGIEVADPAVIVRVGLSEAEKRSHVRSINVCRRHLTATQRRAVIEQQLLDTPEKSDRAVAHSMSVSPTTVAMVRRRLGERAGATVQNGQMRVGRDGRFRRIPGVRTILAPNGTQARRALVALAAVPADALPERILTASDAAIAARIVQRETRREEHFARLREPGPLERLGEGRYSVIYADPPWQYRRASDPTRTAERHYPTMTHKELLALPVRSIAAKSAALFLWSPPPKLDEALDLISSWGFEFKTSAVWSKGRQGMGSWFRLGHELLLIATRGHMPPPPPGTRPGSVIEAPRTRHSAKPDIVRHYIEAMYPRLPRVELFARGGIPGWDTWGQEAETYREVDGASLARV